MRVVKIQGTLTALSPVYHGGNEKTGNVVSVSGGKDSMKVKQETEP